ncbi:MAG: universal stress protein [Rhodothermales bacterium]|nr:universal stress protein [Rhodothermales bacterium]
MLTIKRILVPRDFSACSEYALMQGLDLAQRHGAELHVLYAEVLYADAYAPTPRQASDAALRGRLGESLGDAVPVRRAVVRDVAAAPAIVSYAAEHEIDLIVMGTHGRRGVPRLLLGSTAEEVVRTAPCPVLTVRGKGGEAMPFGSILVPVDFSEHARMALRHARVLAATLGARLDLLHVVEDQLHPAFYSFTVHSLYDLRPDIDERAQEELEAFFEATDGPDVDAAFHVRRGHAAREIVAFAGEAHDRLIVMATHGLRGLDHFLMGSVAERVVRRAPCPVLTLKSFGTSLLGEPLRARAPEAAPAS